MQIFLVVSTCLLYLVAAGLFSRGVGYLEQQQWNNIIGGDATELGNGPGTYDIDKAVWHVNVSSTLFCFPPHTVQESQKNTNTPSYVVLLS